MPLTLKVPGTSRAVNNLPNWEGSQARLVQTINNSVGHMTLPSRSSGVPVLGTTFLIRKVGKRDVHNQHKISHVTIDPPSPWDLAGLESQHTIKAKIESEEMK